MAPRRIVGISGNITRPSRTRRLVEEIVSAAEAAGFGTGETYDVVDAGPELGATVQRDRAPWAVDLLLSAIERSDALVVASPVYKASYTGLLKHLFDLIDPKLLRGRPVLLAATGGSDRHALVIEHQFRPLFGFFGAASLPAGLYATNADFTAEGEPTPALVERIGPAIEQFVPWLGEPAAGRPVSPSRAVAGA
jgi:FMN reductase